MKKKGLAVLVCVICAAIFSGCSVYDSIMGGNVKFTASTRFLYSSDNGTSWSETIQSVYAGEPYFLAVEMQVLQSKETRDEKTIVAVIAIPNTNVLDCYLDDHPGVSITGTTDLENNTTTYKFNVVAGTSPAKFRVVFECIPLSAGKASVIVSYDDQLSESWDATGTIKYIEKVTEPE